jgi:SAM-dependent methyltransferase
MAFTDRSALRQRLYATADKLAARQRLWSGETLPPYPSAAIDLLDLGGSERLLDAGCGNGLYLAELRRRGHRGPVVGTDLSFGMARTAGAHAPTVVGDIAALPYADGAFDVALAMHMLYHVPDLQRAIRELRRVVRSAGTVLVSANGRQHTHQVAAVMNAATRAVTGRERAPAPHSFTLENGAALLSAAFGDVRRVDRLNTITVPAAAVLDYVASYEPEPCGVAAGPEHDEFLRVVAELLGDGPVEVTSHAGSFVCR